ncbi:uncharacterized protein [Porites lutea]|uniref:uncharacterized protein n=1 Tax=Porites lutea TaxID=51062 RepID=UPI003CC5AD5F
MCHEFLREPVLTPVNGFFNVTVSLVLGKLERDVTYLAFRENSLQVSSAHRNSAIDKEKNRCQSRKGIKTLPKSLCRFPCEKDDECVKYGWLGSCCPAIPGSSCKRECLITEDAELNLTSKTCIDAETRKRYTVGETYIKEDKCCTCRFGGTDFYSIRYCDYVRGSFYENNKFQNSAPYDILKGLYHEDLAILDQLCAEFISCKKNSRYYRNGEFIPSRSCYNCSCHNGSVACFFDVSCLQGKCSFGGRIYDEGDVLHLKKSCKDCVCTSGRWNCMMLICSAARLVFPHQASQPKAMPSSEDEAA